MPRFMTILSTILGRLRYLAAPLPRIQLPLMHFLLQVRFLLRLWKQFGPVHANTVTTAKTATMKVTQLPILLMALVASYASAANTMYEANLASEQEDYTTALPIYRAFAAKGDAEAQRRLAHMYMLALGVPVDEERAACWHGAPHSRAMQSLEANCSGC